MQWSWGLRIDRSAAKGDAAPMTLRDWLSRLEQGPRGGIALGLDRVRVVAHRMGIGFECPVILVGGTNGKGSTCAMLESILTQAGYRTALYTSPHLLRFNERLRIAQQAIDDETLLPSFEVVEAARGAEFLTYFEFTSLAIFHAVMRAKPDVFIAEIGLGGRLDAVNILEPDCSIVTAIDIDHAEWLGPTREKIAWEKAHIYRAGRPAICSDPQPPQSLMDYAGQIGADLYLIGRDFNYSGDRQQWSCAIRGRRRPSLAYPVLRGANQLLNASGALAALDALRMQLPVAAQAIRQGLALVDLPGRLQVLPGLPSVILDVAHNPHAVAHLAANLDQMGFFPETYAVVGMLSDKDVASSLKAIASRVQHWMLCSLPGPRGLPADSIEQGLRNADALGVDALGQRASLQCFESPRQALAAARSRAQDNDRIVVFGSFLTVADVLAEQGQV